MKCQEKKVSNVLNTIFIPCIYKAKYAVLIRKYKNKDNEKVIIKYVCGIHKNYIVHHSKKVGYDVRVEE